MLKYTMIKRIISELAYFFGIVVVLAFLQHPDLLLSPLTRFNLMLDKENFFHPLLWSSAVYIFIGLFRLIIAAIKYLKKKRKK